MDLSDGKLVTKFGGIDTSTKGHSPGYLGFCPRQKYHYGKTIGNATCRYFQTRREDDLSCAQTRQATLNAYGTIQRPTFNTNDCSLALSARCLQRDRFSTAQRYSLSNTSKRDEEIKDYSRLVSNHRKYYLDLTGKTPRVNLFILPKINPNYTAIPLPALCRETFVGNKEKKSQSSFGQNTVRLEDRESTIENTVATETETITLPKSTHRDREVRDVFFERR